MFGVRVLEAADVGCEIKESERKEEMDEEKSGGKRGKEVSEKNSAEIYVGEKEGEIVAGGRGINRGTCRG